MAALIPAAGAGERLGRGPKAFVELAGTSLLERAAAAFRGEVDALLVAVPEARLAQARARLPDATVVAGGASRQASVEALLRACDAEWVLVHDAARPLLPRRVLRAALAATRRHGACSVVRPVVDALIEADSGRTVDRASLRAVQTPQGFRRDWLLEAHARARREGVSATDDAALVRRLGVEVALVPGSAFLMKITTPDDLRAAEGLLSVWEER